MADDGIRLRDVVQTEIEQLEEFGEAAKEFFHTLSDDIRQEFTGTLNQLLTQELAGFQSRLARQSRTNGLGQVGTALGHAVGSAIDGLLPGTLFGDVYGAAVGGALRTVVGDFAKNGSFDLGRAVTSANRHGFNRLDRILRQQRTGGFFPEDLPLSRGQRAQEGWGELGYGRRNV